jgi:hypothetical protein
MKILIILLAVLFAAPVMAEVPDFNEGWEVVYAEQGRGGAIGMTLVNTDVTAKWKAAVVLARPTPVGYIPYIVVLYDGCNLKRYVLRDEGYEEFPLTDYPEAEQTLRNHLNQFVPRMEGV